MYSYTQLHRAWDWQHSSHLAISLLTQPVLTWKTTEADSCSSSLFMPTKYPRWQGGGGTEMEEILRNHCSAAFECKKPLHQVPRGPIAGTLESSCAQLLTGLNSSHATINLALEGYVYVALQQGEMSYSRSWGKWNTCFSLQAVTPGSLLFPTSCVCQRLYTAVLIGACGRKGLEGLRERAAKMI